MEVRPKVESGGADNEGTMNEVPEFPKSIHELYKCCTRAFRYGSELTSDHPGYGDSAYKQRREYIATVSRNFRYGDHIPRIEYTAEETKLWGEIFRAQTKLHPTLACKEYLQHSLALFSVCKYREDNIPQVEDVSNYLKAKTNWQLWPVVGWISPRDFLACLAFRCFPTSQYIRHTSSPFYTPEPDVCHELMGHVPLFCDPSFAQFSQEVGLASLGVSDEWIKKLATLYWFTVEFGLVRENGHLKAYGAGLLAGNKELQYCVTDEPEHRDFDISKAMAQKYPENGLQPVYFVAESLDDVNAKMIKFARTIPRPFTVHYEPHNQTVSVRQRTRL